MSTTTVGRGGAPAPAGNHSLRSSSNRIGERIILTLLAGAAGLSVLITVGIVISLILPALSFFAEISPIDFFTGTRWAPTFNNPTYGVLPLIVGTAWTTGIALLVAIPLGLGAAAYLAEYASTRARRILKPILEILAGIPSVVLGFFALSFVAPVLLRGLLGIDVGRTSVLAAGVVLGIFIIPTVASLSEDAMTAVPDSLRQGSAALGANKMTTTVRVVFPAAISGIIAAIVLGVSRAVGETMILALAAGTNAQLVGNPTQPGQTMTGYIAQAATGENAPGSLVFNTLFAVGLTLFVLTLVINIISIQLVRRFREVY